MIYLLLILTFKYKNITFKIMDNQTILIGASIIILIGLLIYKWVKYPIAKYIVLSRTDGDTTKYIAINSIEIIDNYGNKREIVGIEGRGQYTNAWANTLSGSTEAISPSGDIVLNGKNLGYVKNSPTDTLAIGPVMAFLPSVSAASGYLIFTLGCSAKISRINIKSPEDEISKLAMQRVKVYLLDKDKNPVKGTEQIIPVAQLIPPSIHHITFR